MKKLRDPNGGRGHQDWLLRNPPVAIKVLPFRHPETKKNYKALRHFMHLVT